MANMNVSYEELSSAATRLTNGQEELESQLNMLKEYIASLIQSGFVTDSASVAFGETYTNFTTAATQTVANLTTLATNLTRTADILRDTDSEIAARMRS